MRTEVFCASTELPILTWMCMDIQDESEKAAIPNHSVVVAIVLARR